jgi:hypothetical protein
MARKTIYVSDFSGRELNDRDAARVVLTFADARRGQYVVDAHSEDPEVQRLIQVGTKQARRGRKPKVA